MCGPSILVAPVAVAGNIKSWMLVVRRRVRRCERRG